MKNENDMVRGLPEMRMRTKAQSKRAGYDTLSKWQKENKLPDQWYLKNAERQAPEPYSLDQIAEYHTTSPKEVIEVMNVACENLPNAEWIIFREKKKSNTSNQATNRICKILIICLVLLIGIFYLIVQIKAWNIKSAYLWSSAEAQKLAAAGMFETAIIEIKKAERAQKLKISEIELLNQLNHVLQIEKSANEALAKNDTNAALEALESTPQLFVNTKRLSDIRIAAEQETKAKPFREIVKFIKSIDSKTHVPENFVLNQEGYSVKSLAEGCWRFNSRKDSYTKHADFIQEVRSLAKIEISNGITLADSFILVRNPMTEYNAENNDLSVDICASEFEKKTTLSTVKKSGQNGYGASVDYFSSKQIVEKALILNLSTIIAATKIKLKSHFFVDANMAKQLENELLFIYICEFPHEVISEYNGKMDKWGEAVIEKEDERIFPIGDSIGLTYEQKTDDPTVRFPIETNEIGYVIQVRVKSLILFNKRTAEIYGDVRF
jgi:hypothetical protein